MSGIYTLIIPDAATTVARSLIEIIGHATRPFVLLELHLHQTTELGDTAEEQLLVSIKSGQTTVGSGGNAAVAANSVDSGGGTSGFTYRTFDTTPPSGGTIVTHKTFAWNVRAPFDDISTELSQLIMQAARRMSIEIAAPTDSVTMGGWALVQEIGG